MFAHLDRRLHFNKGNSVLEPIHAAIGAGLLVLISAVVQHLNTVWMKGARFVLTDRSAPLPADGFAGRSRRTLQNNLESAAMMVPAALAVSIAGNGAAALNLVATILYLGARTGFTVCYWAGLSFERSLCWAVGMVAILLMSAQAVLLTLP